MRCKFNRSGYWKQVRSGVMREEVSSKHRATEQASPSLPWCTSTESVLYFDPTNMQVARFHQYRSADGSVIGKPDPKELYLDGVLYRQLKGQKQEEGLSRPKWWMRVWGPIRCWLLGR